MSRIISIGTSVPEYGTKQSVILNFMQTAYANETASRKLSLLFQHSGISNRYSVVSDFNLAKGEHTLFNGSPVLPGVHERLNVFKEHVLPLATAAVQNALKKLGTNIKDFGFTHLITVTCTGLYAPGLDAELMDELNLPNDIFHTSINFLGCNAAFHALKVGDMIAKTDENAKVLIVCVELCTLHFQPKNNNDNLLSNTIFGDGAAAVIITSDNFSKINHYKGLTINGFYSVVLNKGKHLMGWNVTPVNFEMVLDAQIPEFIGDVAIDLVRIAVEKLNIQSNLIKYWAIHPGGKRILDVVQKQLQLTDSDLQFSYKVLDAYGNMSSPTILFVMNEIQNSNPKINETIFSVGFGPGLSIETGLFTYAE
jgi:Predicted naringenin-chalcone synthase